MTRMDWWAGMILVVAMMGIYSVMHRYEWHSLAGDAALLVLRIDRWTGEATFGLMDSSTGHWRPVVRPN